jgi:ribosomal protein S18 acetylase RimI-like enzyme
MDMIELVEMPREYFPPYRDNLLREYAKDKVRAGVWSPGEAPRRAEADVDDLLADETDTEGHHLYLLRDSSAGDEVGVVWLAVRDSNAGRTVWIYDIEVYEPFRRRGHGTQALRAVEKKAAELAAEKLELHVFGHNPGAIALYERSGFTTTSIVMSKRLDGR